MPSLTPTFTFHRGAGRGRQKSRNGNEDTLPPPHQAHPITAQPLLPPGGALLPQLLGNKRPQAFRTIVVPTGDILPLTVRGN